MTEEAKNKIEAAALKIRAALMHENLPDQTRRELAITLCFLAAISGNPFLATSLEMQPC